MKAFALNANSAFFELSLKLLNAFDHGETRCKASYRQWETSQYQKEKELPSEWSELSDNTDESLQYFCIETAISVAVRAFIFDEQSRTPSQSSDHFINFTDLREWQNEVGETHCADLESGLYYWPFEIGKLDVDQELSILVRAFSETESGDEHDLFGDVYHDVFSQGLRKALGEFYTSPEIIDYILGKCGLQGSHAWNSTVLDPACGSGSFLIEALERKLKNKPSDISKPDAIHRLFQKPGLVGFDVNPLACEIARLRIFRRIYPYLLSNTENRRNIWKIPIYHIDTLHRTDPTTSPKQEMRTLDEFAASNGSELIEFIDGQMMDLFSPNAPEARSVLKTKEGSFAEPKPLTEEAERERAVAEVLRDEGKFDLVVGNPPYIRIQKIPEEFRKVLKAEYESATGRFDISVLFIEYGLTALKEEGELGFITSNKFLTTQYGQGIRKFIHGRYDIGTIIDFTDTDVFDVTVLPCILTISNSEPSGSIGYSIVKQSEETENADSCNDLLGLIDEHLADKYYKNNFKVRLNDHQEFVKVRCFKAAIPDSAEETWTFLSAREREIISKLDSAKTHDLDGISQKISVGIKTTANPVFVDPLTDELIERLGLEDEIVHPAISGKNVDRWDVDWSPSDTKRPSYILYPHRLENGSVVPVELDDFPNARDYLNEHYEALASRDYLEEAGREWFECWVPQRPDYFDVDYKIVTPEMATHNSFALDDNRYYCIGSCFSVLLERSDPKLYKFVLGLLNSDLLEFYLKANSSTQIYADRFRYNASYIKQLPVILPKDEIPNKKSSYSLSKIVKPSNLTTTEAANNIVTLVELILEGETREKLEAGLNENVYELFGVDKDDRHIIQEFLRFNNSS